jgi:hypothetical protein
VRKIENFSENVIFGSIFMACKSLIFWEIMIQLSLFDGKPLKMLEITRKIDWNYQKYVVLSKKLSFDPKGWPGFREVLREFGVKMWMGALRYYHVGF